MRSLVKRMRRDRLSKNNKKLMRLRRDLRRHKPNLLNLKIMKKIKLSRMSSMKSSSKTPFQKLSQSTTAHKWTKTFLFQVVTTLTKTSKESFLTCG
jgi:hypothetical protein